MRTIFLHSETENGTVRDFIQILTIIKNDLLLGFVDRLWFEIFSSEYDFLDEFKYSVDYS